MGKIKSKFNERNGTLDKRPYRGLELQTEGKKRYVVFSFKDLAPPCVTCFEEWEKEGLLALAMKKLHGVSSLTMPQALQQRVIKNYSCFPPDSKFKQPAHLPHIKNWCSMHIQGKECLCGYVEDNVFHIVFFDKEHKFWPTEKKHT